jgi:hypothetical protein
MRLPLLVAITAVVVGCSSADDDEQLGVVEFYSDEARIEAPASAQVGESFELGVSTFGGGCTELVRTEVVIEGLEVDVRPYDRGYESDEVCTDILVVLDHGVGLSFDQAGSATIRVHGRRDDGNAIVEDEWVVEVAIEE